jgi:hypothetical protein
MRGNGLAWAWLATMLALVASAATVANMSLAAMAMVGAWGFVVGLTSR